MWFQRQLVFTGLMGASVGLPYLLGSAPEWASLATNQWKAESPSRELLDPAAEAIGGALPGSGAAVPPLEGQPVYQVADVLRFDISPDWVYSRWPRKSTALADLDYHGVRVPLVTGIRLEDLAGSLTYYFSRQGRLERIVFVGRTGNPQSLVTLLTNSYGFRPQPTVVAGEHLYQVLWNGQPVSQLKVRPASVLWAAAEHANYEVELDMQRPGSPRYLQQPTTAFNPAPLR